MPEIDLDRRADEDVLVHEWRVGQLRELSLPGRLAEKFADLVDWHDLAALVGRGCPAELALEICPLTGRPPNRPDGRWRLRRRGRTFPSDEGSPGMEPGASTRKEALTMREDETIEVQRTGAPLAPREWLAVGLGSGLLGGIALAIPIVIWDWTRSAHRAFELPLAATAWLFGLEHFSHDRYVAWPLVIGVALLAGYAVLSGLVFTGLADRIYGIARPFAGLGAGLAWSFVSFMFFWYMLLPIARNGAPFRSATGVVGVAPNWVWILGFTLFGVVTGACYAVLRATPAGETRRRERRVTRRPLHRAA